jgi:hypothetical protein
VIARSRRYISIPVSRPCSPCKDVRAILKGIAFFYYGFMVFWWCCCDVVSWSHGAGLLGIWYGAMRGYLLLHLYFSILKKLSTGAMRGNLLWVMCIFLILARRRLYGRIGMSFTGRGNENDRYRMVAEHGNGESKRQNTEWTEQGMTERGMADYYCSLNK